MTAVPGQLHLHPISETHQLRPSLTYLDVLSRKNKRRRGGGGSDSDSDDGPPPDPDDPAPPPPLPKKDKKPAAEAKEVQVSARKSSDDKGGLQPLQGGLSAVRREMLLAIRMEDEEPWEDLEFCDGEVGRPPYIPQLAGLTINTISDWRIRRSFRGCIFAEHRTIRM